MADHEQKNRTGAFKRSSVTKMLIAELNRTTHALPKGEGQYEAQTYLSPVGRVVAKVMIAGTAIEKEDVGKDQPLWRMRITDPSGTTQVYAGGMYQPEAAQAIATLDLPAFVAVVGKLHLYEPEGTGGNVIVSLRPDSVNVLSSKRQDSKARDDFILDAALSTLRSVRGASEEKMKEVTAVYGEKDGKDAYVFVARQVLESLLPSNLFEKKVDQKTCDDKVGEEKSKQDGQKTKQSGTTPPATAPPKLDAKPAPVASPSLSSDKNAAKKTTSAPAYPGKKEQKGKVDKEIDDSIKTVQEVVMQLLHEEVQFKYADLPELLKKKGVNPLMADWESAVKRLMTEGYCCEPRLGIIRVV